MTRKRSKYRPKPVLLNPVGAVLDNIQPITAHQKYLTDLRIKNHSAMHLLVRGEAQRTDVDALVAMTNMTKALFELKVGSDFSETVEAGYAAMREVLRRFMRESRVTLHRDEMLALNGLLELHNAQLEVVTVKQVNDAIAYVRRMPGEKPL